jgi:glycosyltransferase involved in cell wall biosynthesis
MEPPRTGVSVVIPVRNGEPFVCEAIGSVLAQTVAAREVIVVDNLSTDRTVAVVASSFGESVVLASEPHPGAAAARNRGARLARGEYLAFLDADDVWLPGKLERQLDALAARPDAGIVVTHCREFHDPRMTAEQRARFPCRQEPYPHLAASTVVMKRETFERVGDFPDLPVGEFIAWFGWARALGLRAPVLPEVWVKRRVHGANSSLARAARSAYPAAAKWLLDRRRLGSSPVW